MYIVSDLNKSLAFEWVAAYFKDRTHLSFVLIGKPDTLMERFLRGKGIKVFLIDESTHSSMMQRWITVVKIMLHEKPDVVHCHLWKAMLVGLSAAWVLRIPKRVVTRHHALIHYVDFPSGRKWDRLCNFFATDIIAISERIRSILVDKDKADPSKVSIIHHGFDLNYFESVSAERVSAVRVRHHIPEGKIIIGVIARYIRWKGIPFIVDAFAQWLQKHPDAHLVLANASGPYEKTIREHLSNLPSDSFTELAFEEDLPALYRVFDLYVHVPIDADAEAFGQTYIEALACGIPSVFTLAGVASEFIVHNGNAVVVDFGSSSRITEAMEELFNNKEKARQIVEAGKQSVKEFSLQKMLTKLEQLYG
jgi:glycosyltransferase involved in cell wall biosynthesis